MKTKRRGKRVLVCGGRDFGDRELVYETLSKHDDNTIIIHGRCPSGADLFAHDFAEKKRWAEFSFPAQWHLFDKPAGHIRNQRMVDEVEHIDIVYAFKGNRGTRDMMKKAKSAGIKVKRIGW